MPVPRPVLGASTTRRFVAALGLVVIAVANLFVASAPAVAQAPAEVGHEVGISPGSRILWVPEAEQERELDLMVAAGARWVRVDFALQSVQPEPDWWYLDAYDRIVANAHERGLRILGIPSYVPGWARRPSGPAHFDVDAFAHFAGEVARRYGPRGVRHWEVWNEPNQQWAWGAPPDPEAYAVVLRKAAASIRRADPGATVISGGTAPAADDPSGWEISPRTFIRRMYDAGGGAAIDAVAMHPYTYPELPSSRTIEEWNAFLHMDDVRRMMVARGDGHKRIWLTEIGAPTGTARLAVSERRQAEMVTDAIGAWSRLDYAGPMMWYSMRDTGTDASDREANFGMVRRDFSPKPALAAFTAAASSVTRPPAPPAGTAVPTAGSPDQRLVDATYQWLLGRPADAGGLAYNVAVLHRSGIEAVEIGLAGSAEYRRRAGGTDGAVVARLYRDFLGRAADAGGLGYWTGRVTGGLPAGAVAAHLERSGEAHRRQVRLAYDEILGRPADPGGLAYWTDRLNAGLPRLAFREALAASTEAKRAAARS
ncbi:hypothetical protein BH24ACT3_BH24ACT3_10710 [soil metagenome]